MTDDELDLIKAFSEGTAKGTVDAFLEPIKTPILNILDEPSKALGQFFTQVVKLKTANALEIMRRAKKSLHERGKVSQGVPLKLLDPILQYGSLEDDEHMKNRWAALLASAADSNGVEILSAAFPVMLKDLSFVEVYILDVVYGSLIDANMAPDFWIKVRVGVQENFLPEGFGDYVLHLALENLNRLGLTSWVPRFDNSKTDFYTTMLGFAFVRACHVSNPNRDTLTYHVDDDRGGTLTATIMEGKAKEHPVETSVEDLE